MREPRESELRETTRQSYENYAADYLGSHIEQAPWDEAFEHFRGLVPRGTVLDIGCGPGTDTALFLDAGYDYIGLDFAAAMVERATTKFPAARFIHGDVLELPFDDESIDGFWACASLFHLPRTRIGDALDQLRRVLRPGGAGFITLKDQRDITEGLVTTERFKLPRFYAFYTSSEFREVLSGHRLEVAEERYIREGKKTWLGFFVRHSA